ncbi:MAG: rRNA methyltransferase, partial [Clostridia bacterium]|nr:rRNA methyltransferase [Clostridia bacterium]
MDMPEALREIVDHAALAFPNAELRAAVRSMTERYTLQSGKGIRLVTEPAAVAAYAAVRMPATFCAVSAALEHTLRLFSGKITSLLDIGTGTGTCPWAVREALGEGLSITCIER